jgi:hypothetical protein
LALASEYIADDGFTSAPARTALGSRGRLRRHRRHSMLN